MEASRRSRLCLLAMNARSCRVRIPDLGHQTRAGDRGQVPCCHITGLVCATVIMGTMRIMRATTGGTTTAAVVTVVSVIPR
jgi:hypothetical protein